MRRLIQLSIVVFGVLFFLGLTASFGQTADPNKKANSAVQSPAASYPRVPGIPIAPSAAQPASASPTLEFPANARTSRAALTTKASSAAKSGNSGGSNASSSTRVGDSDA